MCCGVMGTPAAWRYRASGVPQMGKSGAVSGELTAYTTLTARRTAMIRRAWWQHVHRATRRWAIQPSGPTHDHDR